MKEIKHLLLLAAFLPFLSSAQAPSPALIGYFHNWQDASAPYIQLDQVDMRYNMIDVAFAVPLAGTDYNMQFVPDQVSQATFISQIQTLHNQGRKVLISLGGANAPVSLDNASETLGFINSMTNILNTYGFDGMDIDFEGSSISVTGGTIAAPVDPPITSLIFAVKQIMANYYSHFHHQMILTMAPETAYVQGGQSAYGGIWGAYLPVIHALRDSLSVLHVQLYNSGSMYGVDGNIYTQGTADFIVAMCEAVIHGFNTSGGSFAGLPAGKVAAGLPACSLAAGGGFTDTATVAAAIRYLRGTGPQPGSYHLYQAGGYPSFRGMMTWSINWDALASCGGAWTFASGFQNIFGTTTSIPESPVQDRSFTVFPNPAVHEVNLSWDNPADEEGVLSIFNSMGQCVESSTFNLKKKSHVISTSILSSNLYHLSIRTNGVEIYSKKIVVIK